MRSLVRLVALFLLVPATGFAQSVRILDFDDLVGAGPMPVGYGGVADWGTWSYSDVPDPALPPWSGDVRISSTGPQRRVEFGQDVTFGGARIVAEAPFRVHLYRAGQLVHSTPLYGANAGGPPRWLFPFSGSEIDALELECATDRHAIDDLIYAVSPTTLGDVFCFPNQLNSTGGWGVLAASGSDLVADNDLTLHATDLSLGSWGFAIVSATQGVVPGPTGPGILCLNGQIGRFVGPSQINNSGTTGAFDIAVDLANIPTPTGFVSTSVGDTWNFQVWYRDTTSFGSATSHFTSGVEITFQ
jgi:hypothetical protein